MIHRCKDNTKIFGVLVTLNHSGIECTPRDTRFFTFSLACPKKTEAEESMQASPGGAGSESSVR
jgi:hypothetical protein